MISMGPFHPMGPNICPGLVAIRTHVCHIQMSIGMIAVVGKALNDYHCGRLRLLASLACSLYL